MARALTGQDRSAVQGWDMQRIEPAELPQQPLPVELGGPQPGMPEPPGNPPPLPDGEEPPQPVEEPPRPLPVPPVEPPPVPVRNV